MTHIKLSITIAGVHIFIFLKNRTQNIENQSLFCHASSTNVVGESSNNGNRHHKQIHKNLIANQPSNIILSNNGI